MTRRPVQVSPAFLKAYAAEITDRFKGRAVLRELVPPAARKLATMAGDLPLVVGVVRIPAPAREHRFHASRRWRFDFAWEMHKLALEVQGGIFTRGRHTRGAALLKEHEKLNAAAIAGWRVLYCTPRDVKNGAATKLIALAIAQGYDDDE